MTTTQRVDVERLSESIRMIEGCRVFVTTREKIKHPEGTDLFDESVRVIADALPALLRQLAERDAEVADARETLFKALAADMDRDEPLRMLATRASNALYWRAERAEAAERAREGLQEALNETECQLTALGESYAEIYRARGEAHKELDSAMHEIAGLSPNGYADSYVARIAAFLAASGKSAGDSHD